MNSEISFPKLKVAGFLLKKKLGLRGLLDVIPLDASLVKGSHGRENVEPGEQPVWIGSTAGVSIEKPSDVYDVIKQLVGGKI